jgi:hypothetical protein
MSSVKHLGLVIGQVQLGLASMSEPKSLDLIASQVQDNVSLINMLNLKSIALTVSQAQGSVNLTNMSNLKSITLVVN